MNFNRLSYLLVLLALVYGTKAMAQSHERVTFATTDGGKIEASLFAASETRVVIFAHGAIFDKESWYFLAEAFQTKGVSALPIDFRGYGNSTPGSTSKKWHDILGAVSYLQDQGYTDINIIGASMGGAAVLMALSEDSSAISKVVLLAPAGGPAIESTELGKLFVVSEKERMFDRVRAIYAASAEPKQIEIYPGQAHAQHLFKTDVADELVDKIVSFIVSEKS